MKQDLTSEPGQRPLPPGVLTENEEQILKAVKAVAFGSVEIVVHDGRVVQIEKREKVRLDR